MKSDASCLPDPKKYNADYRQKHPLLQARIPRELYDEAKRRAASVDFSMSKWLGKWLELTFTEHPMDPTK